jgi:hypothetical protein
VSDELKPPDEPKPQRMDCSTHGASLSTFACVHLAASDSAGLGVRYDVESEEPWPDLVCDSCGDEPEWTDEQALERIRVLCSSCWEDAFNAHTRVHHRDPNGWLEDARQRAARRQDRWADRFRIHDAARYRYGLEDSPPWLGFGPTEGHYEILCDASVIGSWSSRSQTWLWGWANDWWDASLTREMVQIKRAGERLGIEPLWRGSIPGDESVAWRVSAAALDLLPSLEGIYRSPTPDGSLFLAVRNTRRVT